VVLFDQSLPAAVELVRACPQVQFVLDHLGKPRIRDRILDPWRRHLAELASLPNVVCKVWEGKSKSECKPARRPGILAVINSVAGSLC